MKLIRNTSLLFATLLASCEGPMTYTPAYYGNTNRYAPSSYTPTSQVVQTQPTEAVPSSDESGNLAALAVGAGLLYLMFGGGLSGSSTSPDEAALQEHARRQAQNRYDYDHGRPLTYGDTGH